MTGAKNIATFAEERVEMLPPDHEPVVEKVLLVKQLSNGSIAKVNLIRHLGEYKAALTLNDKQINGPPLPQLLDNPSGDVTHWMGNKPSVGLTTEQAELIIEAVEDRNRRARQA